MPAETAWQARVRREKERDAYIAEHGNVCELCGNPPKNRGLSEDHDHRTGKHRGWLCFRCNRALPVYVDAAWMRKALAYLERRAALSVSPAPTLTEPGVDERGEPLSTSAVSPAPQEQQQR